ncbi:Endonuclease/exonuclease/phosphatase [Stanieria sp. NIES-3757]|nr:Endonuclease/exonuclease/phosphatase [Stanieria sp. NIES-3757]
MLRYLLLSLIIAITFMAFFSSYFGWKIVLEILSHFQVQYLIISLILFAFLIIIHSSWKLITIALFCIAITSTQILSFYIFASALSTHSASNLKIISSNVNTQNYEYDKLISLVRQTKPDLALFMEVDKKWIEKLDSLKDLLPYSFGRANPFNLGIVIYSKIPLNNPTINLFGTSKNYTILTDLKINKKIISLIATHPLPPLKPSFFHSRNLQLSKISQYIKNLHNPVIVLGDLNTTMWSPYYKKFIRDTKLINARKGFGSLPSWPTRTTYKNIIPDWMQLILSIPIDHCLVSPKIKVVDIYTGSAIGSDHLPLIVELTI